MAQQKQITDEEILQDLRKTADEVEGSLSVSNYSKKGRFSHVVVQERFGSWNQGKKKAGLKDVDRRSISENELIEDLRRVAADVEGSLTQEEYSRKGCFSPSTVKRTFDSWSYAKKKADVGRFYDVSNEEILEDLRRVYSTVQGGLLSSVYSSEGLYTAKKVRNRFSSFSNGLEEAGLDSDEVFFNIKNSDELESGFGKWFFVARSSGGKWHIFSHLKQDWSSLGGSVDLSDCENKRYRKVDVWAVPVEDFESFEKEDSPGLGGFCGNCLSLAKERAKSC